MLKEFVKFEFLGLWGFQVQIVWVAKFWTSLHKAGDTSKSTNIL